MDAEPGTDVLNRGSLPRRPATRLATLVAGLLGLTGCSGGRPTPPPDLPAVGGQVSILRVPTTGGPVEAYLPNDLATPIWTSRNELPRLRAVLGVNVEARLLYVVDVQGNLLAVDLESRGIRPQATGVTTAVMGGDGAVYALAGARRISRYQAGLPTPFRSALPADPVFQAASLGNRYLAVVRGEPRKLIVVRPEETLHTTDVPAGSVASTYWGDLVAVADGERIALYQTEDPYTVRAVRAEAPVRQLLFSPSGHRLFVAHEDASIEIFDRYGLDRLSRIRLPGVPGGLRTDGSGRWLLARPEVGDSAWVVDLATGRLTATVETEWSDDLPTVAGAATLLARRDGDMVTVDLSVADHPELGRISGGALDGWVVSAWQPKERQSLAAAAAESVLVAQDSFLVQPAPAEEPAAPPVDRLYIQVSTSQNADWSKTFAEQLVTAGYPARVLDPTSPDEGYRVVVGPFPTREAAEETGRRLDRPYFILTNPPIKQ